MKVFTILVIMALSSFTLGLKLREGPAFFSEMYHFNMKLFHILAKSLLLDSFFKQINLTDIKTCLLSVLDITKTQTDS